MFIDQSLAPLQPRHDGLAKNIGLEIERPTDCREASVVRLSVVGISATSKRSFAIFATVRLTPSSVTEPFGTMNFISSLGG